MVGGTEEELIDVAVIDGIKWWSVRSKRRSSIQDGISRKKSLVKMDLREFCNETLSDSPAPGGGSVAALMGALGASLGGMVANLSAGKRGWEDKLQYFSDWAVKAQQLKDELLFLVDEDTAAFNKVMAAFGLPKESAEEKASRSAAIQSANKYAAEVPLRVMETATKAYELLGARAGNHRLRMRLYRRRAGRTISAPRPDGRSALRERCSAWANRKQTIHGIVETKPADVPSDVPSV